MRTPISNSKFPILDAVFVFILFVVAFEAHAQYGFTDFLGSYPGQQFDVLKFLRQATCYFYQVAIIIFGAMLVIYGLMFFKSRGSPQGMTEARKALTWGLVGGLVIFAVFTIIMSVTSFIGADSALLNMISCQ